MALRALRTGVAVTAACAVLCPSIAAPPPRADASHGFVLAAAALPLVLPTTPYDPYDGPSLFDLIGHGVIVPSLGQAPPTPPPNTPIPGTTSANQAIKNIYNAVEPWVRYGFELATYAVGWVPWVGWLSGQIMIFYNFGERIVQSITFNVADWLFGPLPFLQGLRNVARDSWNALVQLGIDEWNYFLPPLPPLPPFPLAATQATSDTGPQRAQPRAGQTPRATGLGSTGRTVRAVRPATRVAVNLPAALDHPPASSRVGSASPQQTLSQRHAANDNSPPKSVGRPKPR
jgi:hypothetical protein